LPRGYGKNPDGVEIRLEVRLEVRLEIRLMTEAALPSIMPGS